MELISLLSETVGAVAVVVSLLYLAVQIRENSRFARASIYQSTTEMMSSFVKLLGERADLNELYFAGLTQPEQLTDAQRRQFNSLFAYSLAAQENLFIQHKYGYTPDLSQERWQFLLKGQLATRGGALFWKSNQKQFNPEFVAYANALLVPDRA
ncbi:MAG: hypothetical protein AAF384_01150 [Pseudomonadota bacterium]